MGFANNRIRKFKEGTPAFKARMISLLLARIMSIGVLIFAIISLIVEFSKSNYSYYVTMILQSLTLFGLTFLPVILEKIWKLDLPFLIVILFLWFCLSSIFFGEIFDFYIKFSWWDDLLHTFSGVYIAAIGFFVISILNEKRDVPMKLSPGFVQIFAFILALASECVWEVFEFSMDSLVGSNMQRAYISESFVENGAINDINNELFNAYVGRRALFDTMGDIIEVMVGAFIACMIGYIALKHNIRLKKIISNKIFKKKSLENDNDEDKLSSSQIEDEILSNNESSIENTVINKDDSISSSSDN